jgi:hypothetical protein
VPAQPDKTAITENERKKYLVFISQRPLALGFWSLMQNAQVCFIGRWLLFSQGKMPENACKCQSLLGGEVNGL